MFGNLGLQNNRGKTKKYFKDNKLSGKYQEFDALTNELIEEGNFQKGVQTGLWRAIDEDGDEIHYEYMMQRVGAICNDGTSSGATGRGACSWHGGVRQWVLGSVRSQIGGTGKYCPIEQRIQDLKRQVKKIFNINLTGQKFEEHILRLLIKLHQQRSKTLQKQKQLQNFKTQKILLATKASQLEQKNKELVKKNIGNNSQIEDLRVKIQLLQEQNEKYKKQASKHQKAEENSDQNKQGNKKEQKKIESAKKLAQKQQIKTFQIKNIQKKIQISPKQSREQKINDALKNKFYESSLASSNLFNQIEKEDKLMKQKIKPPQIKYRQQKIQPNQDQVGQLQANKVENKQKLIKDIKQNKNTKEIQKKVEQEGNGFDEMYSFNSDNGQDDQQEEEEQDAIKMLTKFMGNLDFK